LYDWDDRGRLIRVTEKPTTPGLTIRRILYAYSGADRLIGRTAQYAIAFDAPQLPPESAWKLEDREAVLEADNLPAEVTFAWDPYTDNLIAAFRAGANASMPHAGLLRQIHHGGYGYDDPVEEAVWGEMAGQRKYPIHDELPGGSGQTVIDAEGSAQRMFLAQDPMGAGDVSPREILGSQFHKLPFHESTTNLRYVRARWLGEEEFLSSDPRGYLDSSSLFVFAAQDPVNESDPLGLSIYAFDGTGNDSGKMKNPTNVARLRDAYAGGPVFYREGVGSDWYTLGNGGVYGLGGKRRVRYMLDRLQESFVSGQPGSKEIVIVGFSRGGALALDFANKIHRFGVFDRDLGVRRPVEIQFLGVFDLVASFGIPGNDVNPGYELGVPPNVAVFRHAIARDEIRGAFPLTQPQQCGRMSYETDKVFPGAHSDIGGGYDDNDNQARLVALWMWAEMKNAGIQMHPLQNSEINGPIVLHKSEKSIKHLPSWFRKFRADVDGRYMHRERYIKPCRNGS
ncbi:MAG: DUF2235 domain-containing protein, partial [Thioalkalivibrio sp.]|nr:DUF2235 domain-containing protein [Thioalkalivibrio sp.]